MGRKVQGKSRKIKNIDRYIADTGVYDLNKPYKIGKDLTDFFLVQRSKEVSGDPRVTVWASDENGTQSNTLPLLDVRGGSIAEALKSLGYELV